MTIKSELSLDDSILRLNLSDRPKNALIKKGKERIIDLFSPAVLEKLKSLWGDFFVCEESFLSNSYLFLIKGIGRKAVNEIKNKLNGCLIYFWSIKKSDDVEYISEDKKSNNKEIWTEKTSIRNIIDELVEYIRTLDERKKIIIKYRLWLIKDIKKKTLDEIGREMGITRERVRQIEDKTREELKNYIHSLNYKGIDEEWLGLLNLWKNFFYISKAKFSFDNFIPNDKKRVSESLIKLIIETALECEISIETDELLFFPKKIKYIDKILKEYKKYQKKWIIWLEKFYIKIKKRVEKGDNDLLGLLDYIVLRIWRNTLESNIPHQQEIIKESDIPKTIVMTFIKLRDELAINKSSYTLSKIFLVNFLKWIKKYKFVQEYVWILSMFTAEQIGKTIDSLVNQDVFRIRSYYYFWNKEALELTKKWEERIKNN